MWKKSLCPQVNEIEKGFLNQMSHFLFYILVLFIIHPQNMQKKKNKTKKHSISNSFQSEMAYFGAALIKRVPCFLY